MSILKGYACHNKTAELKFKNTSTNILHLQYTPMIMLLGYGDVIENRRFNSEIQLLGKLFNLLII